MVYWGLAGTLGTQGQKGYRDIRRHWGFLGGVGSHFGVSGVYLGLAGTLCTQGPEGI